VTHDPYALAVAALVCAVVALAESSALVLGLIGLVVYRLARRRPEGR